MAYLGNSPGVASQRVESAFTATSSQTVFTPSSGYTLGYCDVYQNGVKLVNGDDYTAADGATVTLATGAASGDSIVIVASFPRGLSDGYLKSEADAKYVALTGDQTVAGVKTLSSNPILSGGTANGVAYLNGSKVLTSGSALVFDGTNLGVGATLSSWGSTYRMQQIGLGAAVGGRTAAITQAYLSANWYQDGSGNKYIGTGAATQYQQDSGVHYWFNAASGTAGNAITFTQAMTLDASSNLSVDGFQLKLGNSGNSTVSILRGARPGVGSAGVSIYAGASSTVNDAAPAAYITLSSGPLGDTYEGGMGYHAYGNTTGSGYQNAHTWYRRTGVNTEGVSMQLDPSGNLLVGTTSAPKNWGSASPKMRVTDGGIQIGGYSLIAEDVFDADSLCLVADSTENICFGQYTVSNGTYTERARLTPNGIFLVGATSAPTAVASSIASFGYAARSGTNGAFSGNNFNITWTGSPFLYIDTTNIGQIATTSDYRLKENVTPQADAALPKVMQLNPVSFTRKTDGIFVGSDAVEEGFIAHELQEVIPSAVHGEKDALTEDGSVQPQSLNWAPIVSVLTKAIQEQQAIIEQLQADVATLKGTP